MKKTITIIIMILMCLTLISCSKTTVDDNTSSKNSIISNDAAADNSTVDNTNEGNTSEQDEKNTYDGKIVKDIIIYAMGNKVDMEFSKLTPLLSIEDEEETVNNVNEKSVFGNIKLVYEDDSEFEFGEIIISDDNAFYLKLHNGKFYKMADGFFINEEETAK